MRINYQLFLTIFFVFSIIPSAFALKQVAGMLEIELAAGQTGVLKYGLLNDKNETSTLKLRAEGDIVPYISIPESVELQPGKLTYVELEVNIPADYDISNGNEINGSVFALQEGKPGQVQLNLQLKKGVVIKVIEGNQAETLNLEKNTGYITGFSIMPFAVKTSVVILPVVLAVMLIYLIKIKEGNKKWKNYWKK
jgi:hypothetical protein